jgi:uncharacterized protein (DUF2267 family)
MCAHGQDWQIFIYRLPTHPSRPRVAVWRELRRLGALPLQQSVAALPERDVLVEALDGIERRVVDEGGAAYRFRLTDLTGEQRDRLEREWNALRAHEYDEIIEECETKFAREVAFELFRNNLTASEAEEIEADLEKIRTWYDRVVARDWFGAPNRQTAAEAIQQCQQLLDDFVERVFLIESAEGPSVARPAPLSHGELAAFDRSELEPDEESEAASGTDEG